MTTYLIHRTYGKFYIDGALADHRNIMMKYFIYLTAFTLEDFGQVIIQFYYYERFETELSPLGIVNSIFMFIMSLKTVVDLARYSVDTKAGLYK